MRKLTKDELRAIVLEIRKAGFDLEKTVVLLDTFKRDNWYGLGMNFMDGKKSTRIVMPLKYRASLDQVCKQLGRVYNDVRISEKPEIDYTDDKIEWREEKADA